MAVASETKTGNNIAVVAKFEVISVKKFTDPIKINNNKIRGVLFLTLGIKLALTKI